MKSVLVYALLLATSQYGSGVLVCNNNLTYTSTLTTPCKGDDRRVLWPNYDDLSTYYRCQDERLVIVQCPKGTYFNYYYQSCTDCSNYIPTPKCETIKQKTDVTCIDRSNPVTTTPKPNNTTNGTTTTKPNKPTKPTPATKPPTTPNSSVPTPPHGAGIPTPPLVVTPVPGVPTPPSENVTPPSIAGTPPMLPSMASE